MREEQTSCPAAAVLLMIICLGGGVSRTLRFCNAACASEYLHRIFVYTYAICDINWLGGIPHPEAPCVKTMFIFLTETKLLVVIYSCLSITPPSRHALNKQVSSHLFIIVIIFIFQSLVERLNLNAQDITIQSVHPSIIGQDTWFQITYTSTGTTR